MTKTVSETDCRVPVEALAEHRCADFAFAGCFFPSEAAGAGAGRPRGGAAEEFRALLNSGFGGGR